MLGLGTAVSDVASRGQRLGYCHIISDDSMSIAPGRIRLKIVCLIPDISDDERF